MREGSVVGETVPAFRERARQFVRAHLERIDPERPRKLSIPDARALQAQIFDAGFAGIAMPAEYGGAGLTMPHQQVWAEETRGFVIPTALYVSLGILAATLLDHGSEGLKRGHLPKILRGEELWIQLLSEPSCGSDMAAAMTRATRDGDTWVINGAKMWTTNAADTDYGMCLARTDWEAPKHLGLSMFAVPLKDPNVIIVPIVGLGGEAHNFQEFLDNVVIPSENLIGEENRGWSVAHTLLAHEHNATAGVGYGLGLGGGDGSDLGSNAGNRQGVDDLLRYADLSGSTQDGASRQLIAEAYVTERAAAHARERITTGTRAGAYKGDWGSLLKLGVGIDTLERAAIGLRVARADAVIWTGDVDVGAGEAGAAWLGARAISIAAGTNEMQRNIISERLLGMPREPAADRSIPFNEIVRRRTQH
jgi:alkylation response protein AidB-like acyl-CoA dehydrogenase